MSETVTQGGQLPASSPCDQALDYLYEMLEGEDKARFLVHLATCARCQSELESHGRVREVARAVMPSVEPGERLTGALHAQLMHEAAQRKSTGKVLLFMRSVVRHPAYAAAAGLLIIGGAVGLQWSRGKLVMMPAEPAMSAPAVVAPGAAPEEVAARPGPIGAPIVVAAPSVAPALAPPATATAAPAATELAEKSRRDGVAEGQVYDPAKPVPFGGKLLEDRAQAERLAQPEADKRSVSTARSRKLLGADQDLEGLLGDRGGADSLALDTKGGAGSLGSGSAGYGRAAATKDSSNAGPGSPSRQATSAPEPSTVAASPAAPAATAPERPAAVVPAAPAKSVKKEQPQPEAPMDAPSERKPVFAENKAAVARRSEASGVEREQVQPAQGRASTGKSSNERADDLTMDGEQNRPPAQAAAPKPAPPRNVADEELASRGKGDVNAASSSDAVEADRRRAGSLAQAGRCDEAASIYETLDRKVPDRLSPQDRLTYVRCLRTLGRLEPAQSELNQLRANRQQQAPLPAAALNAEQKAIDVDMKRRATNTPSSTGERRPASKAKKAVRAADSYEAVPSAAPTEQNTNQKRLTY